MGLFGAQRPFCPDSDWAGVGWVTAHVVHRTPRNRGKGPVDRAKAAGILTPAPCGCALCCAFSARYAVHMGWTLKCVEHAGL